MERCRHTVAGLIVLAMALHVLAAPAAGSAGASLLPQARVLAAAPYQAPEERLPPPFADLSYDAYRAIRPVPGRAARLPLGGAFSADLLPPGLYFPQPVAIELPAGDQGFAERSFSTGLFDYASRYFADIPDSAPGAGFSGLRLRYPLNSPTVMDEVLVVQGASYFRAIGRAMAYGLSARAVAIGTGGPAVEEFPRFTRLRLHPGSAGAVRIEAVIDGPSLAGHLDMTLRPGHATRARIVVTLIPRREISDIGVAPLTSMYLKGPMRAAVSDDYRPRVHDSNVLVIENGAGERLWRPIANPARVETSSFLDDDPRAFGLWQTARRFEDFEDSEARYQDRPSARVIPEGGWGPGAVMLVEIPTADEFMDNVVAFWRPERGLQPGEEYRYAYRLDWTRAPPLGENALSVRQSRSGREHDRPGTRRFVVDFDTPGGHLTDLLPQVVATGDASVSGVSAFALPDARGTRVTFLMEPGRDRSVDLRLSLHDANGTTAGPVWLHRWTRARDGGV